jgi:hypothetical protein
MGNEIGKLLDENKVYRTQILKQQVNQTPQE